METRIAGSLDMSRSAGINSAADRGSRVQVATTGGNPPLQKQAKTVDRAELELAINEMNEFVRTADRDIGFQLDEDSGRMVVSVTDRETGTVIRQIPSDEALTLAAHLSDARSLLFRAEV